MPGTREMEPRSTFGKAVQPGSVTRTSQASVSAALAAANAALRGPTEMRFPGEDGGRSLADMAQRDLDAALQLLTDRAQYITGSSGAAIALRRSGRNDMLCRASTGSNAPELGALLSTEFGLSGESVRTRRILRCDDAERDARVNHDVCRQMGIASVVVMPVVHDDEVMGVFELFSGKANAFGDRDLSALQRLSEMVETAVKLARAAEGIPERLKRDVAGQAAAEDPAEILEMQEPEVEVEAPAIMEAPKARPQLQADVHTRAQTEARIQAHTATPTAARTDAGEVLEVAGAATAAPAKVPAGPEPAPFAAAASVPASSLPGSSIPAESGPAGVGAGSVPADRKPLFWSAALNMSGDATKPAEVDQSHVPPVLRNLRKCEACGFPVSAGRALCVECEEKKWRGQLKMPGATMSRQSSGAAAAAAPAREVRKPAGPVSSSPAQAGPVKEKLVDSKPLDSPKLVDSKEVAARAADRPVLAPVSAPAPTLILSAGLAPSQSWLARNKYILGALLVVAAAVAAVLLLR
jgi:GAF domain-containing protein